MPVIRANRNENYTVMSNVHLKDKRMTLKAKGLLSVVLSLPPDWDYSFAGLVAICKESETAMKSAIKELKEFGYLTITKERDEKGHFDYVYVFNENPQTDLPVVENPVVENPPTDNPMVENVRQLNTKELNTKELNTKIDIVPEQEQEPIPYAEIITYFNEVAGTHYLLRGKEIKKFIKARWNDGFRLEDFKTVLDKKTAQWKNDAKMSKYLRFETLFSNKFESYLNEVVAFNKPSWNPMNPSGSRYTEQELDDLNLPF